LAQQENYADAEAVYREAIRLDPQNTKTLRNLGVLLATQEKFVEADDAFCRAIDLKTDDPLPYTWHASFLANQAKFEQAIKTIDQVIGTGPDNAAVQNEIAWLLSTAPQDQLRDGQRAIKLARKACELTNFESAQFLDTLAAAHAEVGEFKAAITWSQKAISLTTDDADRASLTQHLENFKANRPWRQEHPLVGEAVPK
jgi:Flp pilus assembly protein TadD